MDLIDRYLTTIRWNLPRRANADDILAELRDVIASRIEDREDAIDRPLNRTETGNLLQDFGHPLVVAARYGTHQSLIGPDLFPFYLFSLKAVLAIGLVIALITTGAGMIFGAAPAMRTIMQGVSSAWWSLLSYAGLTTLMFAVIERTGWLTEHLQKWSPEQLPDLRSLKRKPKSAWESVFEIAVGAAAVLWWAGVIHIPFVVSSAKGISVAPAPIWMIYYWPIFILLAGSLGLNVLQLVRPRWRGIHAALAVALAGGGIALLAILYRAGHWITISAPHMTAEKLAKMQHSIHLTVSVMFLVTGVIWLCHASASVWRFYAARRS